MKRRSLIFADPERVEVCAEEFDGPAAGELLVQARLSAISPGTELLAFRGQVPQEMSLDAGISALSGSFRFPFKYGYACLGEVVDTGPDVDPAWRGRRVFAFHPHESAFTAALDDVIPVPPDITDEDALFLANMETAVNFVQDGRPLLGESMAVMGCGIVGLLTTALLARFPLTALVAFDRIPRRRKAALAAGALLSFDPQVPESTQQARQWLHERGSAEGADLVYEISGSPAALQQALDLAGFGARVVIGSWYGKKPVTLDLGGSFHRSRVQLIASQVSTLAPELSGRWTKARRLDAAWDALRQVGPKRWITQTFNFVDAPRAYELLAERPADAIQVVLRYADDPAG